MSVDQVLDQAIDQLNSLAAERDKNSRRFTTTEELRDFFSNPAKYVTPPPLPLRDAANRLVDLFPGLAALDRTAVTARLNLAACNFLLQHANATCAESFQTKSPALVSRALIALVAEGGRLDIRDSYMALKAVNDAAVKLGMDLRKTFAEAAALVPDDGPRQLNTSLRAEINRYL